MNINHITDAVLPAAPGYARVCISSGDDADRARSDEEVTALIYTIPIIAWHVEIYRKPDPDVNAFLSVHPITPADDGIEIGDEAAVEYPDGSVVWHLGWHQSRLAFAREVLKFRAERSAR